MTSNGDFGAQGGTPAGWYTDPQAPPGARQQRYWDGSSWTSHVAVAQDQGRTRRRWPVLLAVGIGLVAGALIIGVLVGRSDNPPAGVGDPTSVAPSPEVSSSSPATEPSTAPTPSLPQPETTVGKPVMAAIARYVRAYKGLWKSEGLAPSLPLGSQLEPRSSDLRDRFAKLVAVRIRTLQHAGGVLPPSDLELQLDAEREAAEEARRAARQAADQAAAAAAAAEAQGVAAAEALIAREEALERAAEAQREIERLEAQLQSAARTSRKAVTEPADDLNPGDPWGDMPLGVRVLTLKRNMVDLMDTTTQTLLSQQIGPVAHEAARRWLVFMPAGGTVHLTPAGHAAGQVGGRFIYVGRIDT